MSASPSTALAQAVGLEDELRAAGLGELVPLLQPLLDELNRRSGLLFAVDPGDTGAVAFERFWAVWRECGLPVTGKKGAQAAFATAKRTLPPLEALCAAVRAYAASSRVRAGTARNPETWIRKGCWTDDAKSLKPVGKDAWPAWMDLIGMHVMDRVRWPTLSREEQAMVLDIYRDRRRAEAARAEARAEYNDVLRDEQGSEAPGDPIPSKGVTS